MKKSVDRKSLFLGWEGPGYDFRPNVGCLKYAMVARFSLRKGGRNFGHKMCACTVQKMAVVRN